ncbi:MAG: PHP domain-containing protein [Dehalococcoidia bacterium]|nr:PHP domain-containing protein [Dehalococcoidia bacterium]
MFIDLHTHSVSSDDSRANVEQYVKWIGVLRKKGYTIDGFVLTEHRKFDFDKDYSALAEENGILIMKGSELDTNMGHILVYGVNEALADAIDFSDVTMDAIELVRAAEEFGAIAVPAHPGRFGIGLCEFADNGADFSRIKAAERLNGSNRPGEQERAEEFIDLLGVHSTGGSDAHLVSAIGKCMTNFDGQVFNESDLVRELHSGTFGPVRLDETL